MPAASSSIPKSLKRRGRVSEYTGGGPYTLDASSAETFHVDISETEVSVSTENEIDGARITIVFYASATESGENSFTLSSDFVFQSPPDLQVSEFSCIVTEATYFQGLWLVISHSHFGLS